jgi:general secretion pathway protein D
LPTSVTAGVIQGGPVVTSSNGNSSSGGSSSGGTGNSFILNTGGISGVGSFAVSLPATATFALLASDSNSKVLQNPQIRVLNNEKATLRIGDRVPIATGSFQPGLVGGAGVSPLIGTQFQYLDVGVNIDITPHIHADREVTLKMALEISSVTGSQNIGGITQPVIGQRRIEHETRLADGDVNLLAGILEDTETQSLSGYPWVSKVPILKYLFAQENKERQENEIVFAITPHIISAQEITEENQRAIEVGTGSLTELRHKSPSKTVSRAAPSGDAAKIQQPAGQTPVSGPVEAGAARNGAPAQANSPADSKAPK